MIIGSCAIKHHFPSHSRLLKDNGIDWDNGFGKEVRPRQKMITVYE